MHADKGEGKRGSACVSVCACVRKCVCACACVCVFLNGESWVKSDRLEDREIERYTVWSVRLAG